MSDPNMGDENVDEHVCPPRSEDLLDRVVDLRRALEESNFEREHWQDFAEAAYDALVACRQSLTYAVEDAERHQRFQQQANETIERLRDALVSSNRQHLEQIAHTPGAFCSCTVHDVLYGVKPIVTPASLSAKKEGT